MSANKTYIILLNYNGWKDTIACLESLLALRGAEFCIVVCDNASTNSSLEHMQDWARGTLSAAIPSDPILGRLVGKSTRPITCETLSESQVNSLSSDHRSAELTFIQSNSNAGFAAGNNLGLRFALKHDDMTHAWVLNNDTLVETDCLANMHARISLNDQGSVCGSVIHFFDSPNTIQAIGGNRFNRYTGAAMESEGRFRQSGDLGDIKDIEARIDYLSGCSVMVPRHYLKMNGLMNEEFFLYYEEIDWFTRAGNSFDICIAADARVYHREGGSIGSPALRRARPSLLADFHIFRSKHLFMRKYYRIFLPVCYCHTIVEAFKRLVRGQFQNALTVLSVVMGRREF